MPSDLNVARHRASVFQALINLIQELELIYNLGPNLSKSQIKQLIARLQQIVKD